MLIEPPDPHQAALIISISGPEYPQAVANIQNHLVMKSHQFHSPVYTDSEVNGLLDTILRMGQDNRFLLREHQRIMMICRSMKVDILCLQSTNDALRKQIDELLQQIHTTK